MAAVKWIVIWGAVSILAAIAAGVLAGVKNRNPSTWAAWAFVLPPVLIALLVLPRNRGSRPVNPSLDEEDRRMEAS